MSVALMQSQRLAFVKEPDVEAEIKKGGVVPSGIQRVEQGFFSTSCEIRKKVYGIPFLVTEEQELEEATRHHGAIVKIHERKRFMMPFWFMRVAAVGRFCGEVKLDSPLFSGTDKIWQRTKELGFSYPFDDHHRMNQISASYVHDQAYVEECLCSTASPSMLISRFELLEELEKLETPPTVIPFVMSSTTAYNICRGRVTRDVILRKMTSELEKNYGRIHRRNITMQRCDVVVEKIRPVLLPMTKMIVSTAYQPTKLPLFICGASGKTAGPVLTDSSRAKLFAVLIPTAVSIAANAPFVEPIMAISYGFFSGVVSFAVRLLFRMLRVQRQLALSEKRLTTTGLLHFSTDQTGYRWTVEEEEKFEYEYREELRERHFRKTEFEERVREETMREEARRRTSFNAAKRQRNDIAHPDPLGLYALLGLKGRESSVTTKDISEAFREAARVNHPDLQVGADGGGETGAEQDESNKKMQRILEAYRILKDSKKRKDYDCGLITSKDIETS